MQKWLFVAIFICSFNLNSNATSINPVAYRNMQIQNYNTRYQKDSKKPTPYWKLQSNYNTRNRSYNSYRNYSKSTQYHNSYRGNYVKY